MAEVSNSSSNTSTAILTTVKDFLGGDVTSTAFDSELLVNISTVLSILNHMGIGVQDFSLSASSTWADFLTISGTTSTEAKYQMVKTFVCLKVKQLFDPATSSAVSQSLDANLKEIEWRLYSLANFS